MSPMPGLREGILVPKGVLASQLEKATALPLASRSQWSWRENKAKPGVRPGRSLGAWGSSGFPLVGQALGLEAQVDRTEFPSWPLPRALLLRAEVTCGEQSWGGSHTLFYTCSVGCGAESEQCGVGHTQISPLSLISSMILGRILHIFEPPLRGADKTHLLKAAWKILCMARTVPGA